MTSLVLPTAGFGQARPAAGAAVINYQESRGSAIIYLEEAGGLVAPVAPVVAPRRPTAAAPAKPTPAAAPAPAPAAGTRPRIVTRQVADADGVSGKR